MSGFVDAWFDIQAAIDVVGEIVTLRRLTGPLQIPFDVTTRAVVVGFQPDELVGGIIQGDKRVIMGPRDLTVRQWPQPPRKGDQIIIRGRINTIEGVDDVSLGGVTVRYNILVRGAEQ